MVPPAPDVPCPAAPPVAPPLAPSVLTTSLFTQPASPLPARARSAKTVEGRKPWATARARASWWSGEEWDAKGMWPLMGFQSTPSEVDPVAALAPVRRSIRAFLSRPASSRLSERHRSFSRSREKSPRAWARLTFRDATRGVHDAVLGPTVGDVPKLEAILWNGGLCRARHKAPYVERRIMWSWP